MKVTRLLKKSVADTFGLSNPFGRILGLLASINLFSMMLLTLADVVGRYIFNSPVPGAFEVTEVMMGILVFAIFPIITAREEHISIGLFDHFFRGKLNRIKLTSMSLLSAAFIGLLCWRVWIEAQKHAEYGDHTAYLHIPIAPTVYFMGVMAVLTFFASLAVFWDHLRGFTEQKKESKEG